MEFFRISQKTFVYLPANITMCSPLFYHSFEEWLKSLLEVFKYILACTVIFIHHYIFFEINLYNWKEIKNYSFIYLRQLLQCILWFGSHWQVTKNFLMLEFYFMQSKLYKLLITKINFSINCCSSSIYYFHFPYYAYITTQMFNMICLPRVN